MPGTPDIITATYGQRPIWPQKKIEIRTSNLGPKGGLDSKVQWKGTGNFNQR